MSNFPTDKTILNVNRQSANIETNTNNELVYNLIDSIPLNIGDKVTLYKAFLNVPGQDSTTITLEQDFTTTMKFCYYIPQDVMRGPEINDQKKTSKADAKNNVTAASNYHWQPYRVVPSEGVYRISALSATAPNVGDKTDYGTVEGLNPLSLKHLGATGSPAILCEVVTLTNYDCVNAKDIPTVGATAGFSKQKRLQYFNEVILRPTIGKKTFTIPAGNYTVDALAQLITELLNGEQIVGKPFETVVTQNDIVPSDLPTHFIDESFVKQIPLLSQQYSVDTNSFRNKLIDDDDNIGSATNINSGGDEENNSKLNPGPGAQYVFADLRAVNRCLDQAKSYYLNPNMDFISDFNRNVITIESVNRDRYIPKYKTDVIMACSEFLGKVEYSLDQKNFVTADDPSKTFKQIVRNMLSDHFLIPQPITPTKTDAPLARAGLAAGHGFDMSGIVSYGDPARSLTEKFFNNFDYVARQNDNEFKNTAYKNETIIETPRAIGASEFKVKFGDGDENFFQMTNSHTPYKMWSVDIKNDVTGRADASNPSSTVGNTVTKLVAPFNKAIKNYPIDCSSGIMMLSFESNLIEQTPKYKDIQSRFKSFGGPITQHTSVINAGETIPKGAKGRLSPKSGERRDGAPYTFQGNLTTWGAVEDNELAITGWNELYFVGDEFSIINHVGNDVSNGVLTVTAVDTENLGYVSELEVNNPDHASRPDVLDNPLDYYRLQYRKKLMLYWLLQMAPHDYFYDNDAQGANDWESTLWRRLGFSYNRIGKVSAHTEKYLTYDSQLTSFIDSNGFFEIYGVENEVQYAAPGIMSHNSGDLSMVTSISGLGNQLVADEELTAIETFDTVGYFKGEIALFKNTPNDEEVALTPAPQHTFLPYFIESNPQVINNHGSVTKDGQKPQVRDLDNDLRYDLIYLARDPKPIKADSLPVLSKSNYFVIESDIISNNYLDAKGSKKTAIGIVDKQNSSSDTIYSTEGIDFTIKQPTILSRFTIRVTNPDGSDVSDDILKENSGFIFVIERAVNPVLPKPPV